jgi:hypothetical protein
MSLIFIIGQIDLCPVWQAVMLQQLKSSIIFQFVHFKNKYTLKTTPHHLLVTGASPRKCRISFRLTATPLCLSEKIFAKIAAKPCFSIWHTSCLLLAIANPAGQEN